MSVGDANIYQRRNEGRGGTGQDRISLHMDQEPAFRLYTLGSVGLRKVR